MKSFLRILNILAVALLGLVLFFSCEEPGPIDPNNPDGNKIPVESVKLDVTSRELAPGEMLQLTAMLLPENATDKEEIVLVWNSSEPAVARVSDTGLVTAVSDGVAVVTVSITADNKAQCEITVKSPDRVDGVVKASDFGQTGKSNTEETAAGYDYSYQFAPRAAWASDEVMSAVSDVWTDGHMYSFRLPATKDSFYGNSSCLATDDIIVFRDCDAFPGGAAIKIDTWDVWNNSGTAESYEYRGYRVPIEQVFKQLHMETAQLNLGEIRQIVDEEGNPVEFVPTKAGGGFEIAIPEMFGKDFTASLNLGDNLSITPKMRIGFNMDIAADVVDFKLTYARCRVEAEADLSCDLTFKASVEKKFRTKRLTVFLGAIPVGPVVISPVVTMDFEIKLSGQVDLTFSVAYQKSIYAHAFYNGTNLQCRVGEKAPSDPKDPFSVTGSMSGAVEFGPNLGMGVSLYGGALELGVDFDPHLVYTVFSSYPISVDSFRGILNGTYDTNWLSYAGYEPSLAFSFGGFIKAAYAWSMDFQVPEDLSLSYSFGKTYVVPQLADEVTIHPNNGSTTFKAYLKNKAMYTGDMYLEVSEENPTGPPIKVPFTISGTPGNEDGEVAECTAVFAPAKDGVHYHATGPFMTIRPFGYEVNASLLPNKYHMVNKTFYSVDQATDNAIRAILADLYACRKGEWKGCNWFDKDVPFCELKNVKLHKESDENTAYYKEINPAFFQTQIQIFIPDEWEMGGSLSIGDHTGNLNDTGWELYLPEKDEFSSITIDDPNLANAVLAPSRTFTIHSPRLGRFNGGFGIPKDNPADAQIDLSGTGIQIFYAYFEKDGETVPFTGTVILDNCDSLRHFEFYKRLPAMASFRNTPKLKGLYVNIYNDTVEDITPLVNYAGEVDELRIRKVDSKSAELIGENLLFKELTIEDIKSPSNVTLTGRDDLISVCVNGAGTVTISDCPHIKKVETYAGQNNIKPNQSLLISNCPELGLTFTSLDGYVENEGSYKGYLWLNASDQISVSNCPEVVSVRWGKTERQVNISNCEKLRFAGNGSNNGYFGGHHYSSSDFDLGNWGGELREWSITGCPKLEELALASAHLDGVLPALLQQLKERSYGSSAYPFKYAYETYYEFSGDVQPNPWHFRLGSTNPNGYYLPGEPGRAFDHISYTWLVSPWDE